MTRTEWHAIGGAILGWWSEHLNERDAAPARALSARLRRATPVEALCDRAVHLLLRRLEVGGAQPQARDPARLVRLARTLAEVRIHDDATLARRLGGSDPAMSELRFRRLLRSEGDDLTNSLRRAIRMADQKCNVAALGRDILFWSDRVRIRWTFHYYGAEAPISVTEARA